MLGTILTLLAGAASHGNAADDKPSQDGMSPITDPVPGDFKSWTDLFAEQDHLNAGADKIAAARDTGKDDGYAGLTAAPLDRKIYLYWRGPVPPPVQDAVATASKDAPVAVMQAPYSEAELLDRGRSLPAEPLVTGYSPNVDGSGLTVSVSVSEEEGRGLPAVKDLGVPVVIDPFVKIDAVWDRLGDIPSYWGGAKWLNPSGGGCSTGFSVRFDGRPAMLSAGHCGKNGDMARTGVGVSMGAINNKVAGRDTLVIPVSSAAGRIYTGPVNPLPFPPMSTPIKGTRAARVGNYVCTSGSYTGQHCNIRIEAVNQSILTDVGWMSPEVKATSQVVGGVAVGRGDSGGPVTTLSLLFVTSHLLSFGTFATGTISAGETPLGPCGYSPGCYHTVYFADVTQTVAYYNGWGHSVAVMTE
ncbi:S1 family peptidase [Actinocrispum wychmicini]|uniref:S1 family peptidase n=1 Tax=Actinocrispum wychmicini TaxID=1213861 RepID=UPI00105103FF|nr:S1 family peptidase [Actinocrispum wychmicini]